MAIDINKIKEIGSILLGISTEVTRKIPCSLDIDDLEYFEVYGDDPFEDITVLTKDGELNCRNISFFSNHLSFISDDIEIVIHPSISGFDVFICDGTTDSLINQKTLKTEREILNFLISSINERNRNSNAKSLAI